MCPKRRAGFTCPTGFKFGRPRSKAGCPQCPTCIYVNKVSKDKKAKSNKKKAYKEKKAKYIKKKAYKEKKAKYIKKKAYKEKKAKYIKKKAYKEKTHKEGKAKMKKKLKTGKAAMMKQLETALKSKSGRAMQGSTQLETSKHMSLEKQSEHEQEKRNHEEECKRMQLRLEREIHLGVQHVQGTLAKGSNKRATALMHSVQNQVHIQTKKFVKLCRL
jgi:hypothetical protein